jgi:hypothetical protein
MWCGWCIKVTYEELCGCIFDFGDFGFAEAFDVFEEFAVGGEDDLGLRYELIWTFGDMIIWGDEDVMVKKRSREYRDCVLRRQALTPIVR